MCGCLSSKSDEPSSGPEAGLPCDGGVQPCPLQCKPISAITLLSMTFKSDHDLLKDYTTDWKDGGARFIKPEWTPAKHDPITHSMDKQVSVELELNVEPANACVEVGDVKGAGPDGMVFQELGVSFKPGTMTVTVTSGQKLRKKIQKLPFAVSWSTTGTSAALSANTSDDMFVTIDVPRDSGEEAHGVTLKRMAKAVDLVGPMGTTNPHTIVQKLMTILKYYVLSADPKVPSKFSHPNYYNSDGGAWPMADFLSSYGECQAIVRFVRKIITQLGAPGIGVMVYVYADPAKPNDALEDPEGASSPALWHHIGYSLVDKPVTKADVGRRYPPSHTKMPDGSVSMGFNAYEACLKFTAMDGPEGASGDLKTYYYPGGTGGSRTESLDRVLKGSFNALVEFAEAWYPNDKDPKRVSGAQITKIMAIYH